MRKAKTVSEMTAKELEKIRKVKYFLLDMDGTIYLDTTVIDGTHEFLAEVKKQGKRIFYITNNSSKAVSQYVEKLAKMDIRSEEEDFYTSVDATVKYLDDEMPGAKLFVIGTDALKDLLRFKGFETVEKYEKEEAKRPDFVLLAFDTSLTYDKLNTACMYLQDGVKYIATHPDKVCPLDGFHSMPDAGSFMDLLECATGRRPSFIAGKPEPTMILMIMEKLGCAKDEIAVVGDRLNTDVLSAVNAGVVSVCVLSGEATEKDVKKSKFAPDFVFKSVKELCEAIK